MKTEIQINGTKPKDQRQIHAPMDIFSLTTEAKVYSGEDSISNKWCWENWSTTCKRMNQELFPTPYTKIDSKWIKDIYIIPKTIKLLEKTIGRILSNINHSKILYDPPPRILEVKAKINK